MTPQPPVKGSRSDEPGPQEQAEGSKSERGLKRRIAVLDIPAPCAWLNSNQRLHRMQAAKLTKQWREAGARAAEDIHPFDGQVHITAHVWKDRNGRYDVLNLWPSLKATIDGIVDAGTLKDDDWKHVIGPDMRHGGKGTPRLVLTIEEA